MVIGSERGGGGSERWEDAGKANAVDWEGVLMVLVVKG